MGDRNPNGNSAQSEARFVGTARLNPAFDAGAAAEDTQAAWPQFPATDCGKVRV